MKNISRYLAIAGVIVVVGLCANAAIGIQIQTDKTFQGTLVKVDPDTHILTVRGADSQEWYFGYGDDTQMVGPAKDVEGLTGKPGANLKITYHVEGSANHATRIEVVPPR